MGDNLQAEDTLPPKPRYKRVLLKLSGEALSSSGGPAIVHDRLYRFVEEIGVAAKLGVEIAIVNGGGNIFRGNMANDLKIEQDEADHMGMLATVINAKALRSALEECGHNTRIMSAVAMPVFCETYSRLRALRNLDKGHIIILAAGTGNPRFTTDTAAVMRGAEIKAELVLKATDVEGIFDKDPRHHKDARLYRKLPFREAISRELQVMDGTAMTLAYTSDLPVRVFSLLKPGNITRALIGEELGTLVTKSTDIVMADTPMVSAE